MDTLISPEFSVLVVERRDDLVDLPEILSKLRENQPLDSADALYLRWHAKYVAKNMHPFWTEIRTSPPLHPLNRLLTTAEVDRRLGRLIDHASPEEIDLFTVTTTRILVVPQRTGGISPAGYDADTRVYRYGL